MNGDICKWDAENGVWQIDCEKISKIVDEMIADSGERGVSRGVSKVFNDGIKVEVSHDATWENYKGLRREFIRLVSDMAVELEEKFEDDKCITKVDIDFESAEGQWFLDIGTKNWIECK